MDLLLSLEHTKINCTNDFDVIVEDIDAGWMDLRFGLTNNKLFFEISYLYDPLNDLLETTVLLLAGKPMNHNIYKDIFNFSFCNFELESQGNLHWIIRKIDDTFYIYLWHNNMYQDEIIDLQKANCDSEQLKTDLFFSFEDFPDLNKNLLFAIECNTKVWCEILIKTFTNLPKKYDLAIFQDCWGYTFDKDNFEILNKFK